jgi:hypothetical protein
MQPIHSTDDDLTGSASRTDSDIEQGLHENLEAGLAKEHVAAMGVTQAGRIPAVRPRQWSARQVIGL